MYTPEERGEIDGKLKERKQIAARHFLLYPYVIQTRRMTEACRSITRRSEGVIVAFYSLVVRELTRQFVV